MPEAQVLRRDCDQGTSGKERRRRRYSITVKDVATGQPVLFTTPRGGGAEAKAARTEAGLNRGSVTERMIPIEAEQEQLRTLSATVRP